MITYSNLGIKGNLGNQLFQIASTIGIALKNNQNYFFPKWAYSEYFQNELPVSIIDATYTNLKENSFQYYHWELQENKNYNIDGWLQSEKYFDVIKTKEIFQFKVDLKNKLISKHQYLFTKKTILVSVRRGDFVNHKYYFQLNYRYYILALIKNFPDINERNIIFTSDDINYCKTHFSFLKNSFFLENLTAIEQLIVGSNCNDYIISNSTFSWWMAWLGEKENSRIYRPLKNFRGNFAQKNNDSDFFPNRWIIFNDKLHKLSWKYYKLIIRGNSYIFVEKIKYYYKICKKQTRKTIKKAIS